MTSTNHLIDVEQACGRFVGVIHGAVTVEEPSSNPWRRKGLRWKGFEYHTPGTYFVTICTANRRPLFGQVDGTGRLHPSRTGICLYEVWYALPDRFPNVELLAFVAMPDHVHGIVEIKPQSSQESPLTLGRVISVFKSLANHSVRKSPEQADTLGSIWQQGYHDRVIRSDDELRRMEWYIVVHKGEPGTMGSVSNVIQRGC